MRDSSVDSALIEALGVPIATGGVEVRWCCPFCPLEGQGEDNKFHLYYNAVTGKWFCHRHGKGGGKEFLYKKLKLAGADPAPNLTKWDDAVARFLNPGLKTEAEPETHISLPDYTPLIPGTDAWSYCMYRGFTEADIRDYWLGFGTQYSSKTNPDGCKGRVIFPDFKQGTLLYWTARLYVDAKPNVPRYKNPSSVKKAASVFNLERAKDCPYMVICEGPISAMVAGREAVATYSKTFSRSQVDQLVKCDSRAYVVAYDGDALQATINLAGQLYSRGKEVRLVLFEDKKGRKDPADIGREAFRARLKEAPHYDPSSILRILLERSILRG